MTDWIKCPSAKQLQLLESSVFVGITGWLADVTYSLTYENSAPETLEDVRFVFPVDDSSSVYRLVAELNGRTIECECREKAEAEASYQAAVAKGLSAAFASEADGASDLMDCFLGNVASGGRVRICMRSLVALEAPERGTAILTVPRVLVPRYEPPGDVKRSERTVAEATGAAGVALPWLLGLQLRGRIFNGSAPVRSLRCNQGSLLWQQGREEFSVTELGSDCDIELVCEFELPASNMLVVREAGGGSGPELFRQEMAALTLFLDDSQLGIPEETSKEFVIVVDCSGSMAGGNMTAAREALLLFLKSLPRGCHFNVVRFGSSYDKLFPACEAYSEANLKKALQLQESMGADMGGTEILEPLRWVFGSRRKDCQTRVVLLTDGEVSNADQVKDLVLSSCGSGRGCRVFAIGIGHGASTSLVKGVARVGRGRADFVRDGDSAQLRKSVIGLLKVAQLSGFDSIQLDVRTPEGSPVLLGTVPAELAVGCLSQLSASLILAPEAAGRPVTVTVRASGGGRELSVDCDAAPPAPPSTEDEESATPRQLLHRATARLQLKEWTDENSDGRHTRSIVELSLAANIISACTAFLGIDKESGQPVVAPRSLPEDDVFESYKCMRAPASANRQFCSAAPSSPRMMACSAAPSMIACSAVPNASKAKSKGLFNFRLPTLNLFGKKSDQSGRVKRCANVASDCLPIAQSARAGAGTSTAAVAPVPSSDAVMQIASSQEFDGRWEVSEALLDLLQLSRAEVQLALPDGVVPAAWFTALVSAHLTTRLLHLRAQWELLMVKAVEYLKSACADASQLMDKATVVIKGKAAAAAGN